MIRKIFEKINFFVAKSPKKAVLIGIMLFNVIFFMISAGIISGLSHQISGIKECGYWESLYYTITMVLDAGCIDNVIADVGKAGVVAVIVCLIVIIVGMVLFVGAVVGYMTNGISAFIESKNNGKHKLLLSDHIVIINWNSRGAELIKEYLYDKEKVQVVVFVPENKEEIDKEIRDRLDSAIIMNERQMQEDVKDMFPAEKRRYLRKNRLSDNISYIVREGDISAATDLDNICISKARSVIILDNDDDDYRALPDELKGNATIVKTLIQIDKIFESNIRGQNILVEVEDRWTKEIVNRIIEYKRDERDIIIPISYRSLPGQMYSQIAIMPELSTAFNAMFSSHGSHFVQQGILPEYDDKKENEYLENHLAQNCYSIPLGLLLTSKGRKAFFMADNKDCLKKSKERFSSGSHAKLKDGYTFKKRNIVVLGHNSNMDSLMEGFDSFRNEQALKGNKDVINVVMVDEEESLKEQDYYRKYPYVETLVSNVYHDREINEKIVEVTQNGLDDTTVLILSDDAVDRADIDAGVLTYLICFLGQLHRLEKINPNFKRDNIEIIVEILNPENKDIVTGYGVDKVIISNSYLSHFFSNLSLGKASNYFKTDVLSNNIFGVENKNKGIFVETAEEFFEEIPGKCTACDLIRMVYYGCRKDNKIMVLGYIPKGKECVIFKGDQREIEVELKPEDTLIFFGDH